MFATLAKMEVIGTRLVTKAIFKVSMQVVAGLVIYSVLLYSALMIEESGIGVIRDKFDEYAQTLNKDERNKPFHELSLGEGSILYFATDKDDKFNLNFEYEGEKRINRDQILQLARQWLIAKGYTPDDTAEFYLYPITYRKNISFDLNSQNNIGVIFGVDFGNSRDVTRNRCRVAHPCATRYKI